MHARSIKASEISKMKYLLETMKLHEEPQSSNKPKACIILITLLYLAVHYNSIVFDYYIYYIEE